MDSIGSIYDTMVRFSER